MKYAGMVMCRIDSDKLKNYTADTDDYNPGPYRHRNIRCNKTHKHWNNERYQIAKFQFSVSKQYRNIPMQRSLS